MAGVNKVIILGNLGRDPELRRTQSGSAVCNLSVATTRKWKNKQTNEMQEETEWHRIVVWGNQAEHCEKYLSKGRQVYVEGRLKTTKYEKEGVTHYTTDIVADAVQFVGGSGGNGSGGRSTQSSGQGAGGYSQTPPASAPGSSPDTSYTPGPVDDDDIPF